MDCRLLLLFFPALLLHAEAFTFKREEPYRQSMEISLNLSSGADLRLQFVPGRVVGLLMGDNSSVFLLHQISGSSGPVRLRFRSSRPDVLKFVEPTSVTLSASNNTYWPGANASFAEMMQQANASDVLRLTVEGVFLGRAEVVVEVENGTGTWTALGDSLKVSVIRRLRWIDRVFTFIVVSLVMIANLGMGTNLELKIVRKVLRRPLAPAIGFCCQYTIMPLVAYGVGTLLKLRPIILLGYFALGCAPGGGASNFHTYLLGGDVSLSITMTLVSTLAALGMVPLWLFTLGQHILRSQGHTVKIPFQNIIISLVTMLVPIAIGYAIKKKLPKVAKIINKIMKPFLLCLLIFFFTVGVYANLFIFQLFSPIVIAAGCLLPYGGFFLGGLVAFLARLKFKWVKTVSIETGIQNVGVPILLLKFSLPQPDSDTSIVGPIAAAMFTPAPLFICILIREIYLRRCKKKKDDEEAVNEGDEEKEEEKEKEEMKEKKKKEKKKKKKEMDGLTNGSNEQEPFLEEETKA